MDPLRKLTLLVTVVVAAGLLLATPVAAAEDAPEDQAPAETSEETPATQQDEGHRRQIAETPRDRLGLLLLGSLVLGGGLAVVNARRQLRGERPQASGDFRWR